MEANGLEWRQFRWGGLLIIRRDSNYLTLGVSMSLTGTHSRTNLRTSPTCPAVVWDSEVDSSTWESDSGASRSSANHTGWSPCTCWSRCLRFCLGSWFPDFGDAGSRDAEATGRQDIVLTAAFVEPRSRLAICWLTSRCTRRRRDTVWLNRMDRVWRRR